MLNKRQKSVSPLNLIFSNHHKKGSVSSDTSSLSDSSSQGSKRSEEIERASFSDDSAARKKSFNVSTSSLSYYDEFTPTANLGALEILSPDISLLDEDPFALTPPASPRTATQGTFPPPHPSDPLIPFYTSVEVYPPPTFVNVPSTYPKTPTKNRPSTPIKLPPMSFTVSPPTADSEKNVTGFTFPPPSPTFVVKSHSPLSPAKILSPSSTVRSNHLTSPRRKVTPPQPSLDVLTAVELMKAPSQRKGRVGGDLPLEPWNDYKSETIQPVVPIFASNRGPYLSGVVTATSEQLATGLALRQVKSYTNMRKSPAPSHTRFSSVRKMGNWSYA